MLCIFIFLLVFFNRYIKLEIALEFAMKIALAIALKLCSENCHEKHWKIALDFALKVFSKKSLGARSYGFFKVLFINVVSKNSWPQSFWVINVSHWESLARGQEKVFIQWSIITFRTLFGQLWQTEMQNFLTRSKLFCFSCAQNSTASRPQKSSWS